MRKVLSTPTPNHYSIKTGSVIATLLLLVFAGCQTAPEPAADNHTTWKEYGGGADQSKYADLKQITKQNVSQLKMAWFYSASDSVPYFYNPIIVDSIMYVVAKNYSLVAL